MKTLLKKIRALFVGGEHENFISEASAVFVIHAASIGLVMIVNILAGRLLGPEKYGIYTYSLSLVMLMSMLSQFGMNTAITRKVSAYNTNGEPQLRNRFLGFVFALALGLSLSLALVAFLALRWSSIGDKEPLLYATLTIGCLVVPLFALNPLLSGVLRGFKKVIPAYIFLEFFRPGLLVCVLAVFFVAGQQLDPQLMLILNGMALSFAIFGSFLYIKTKLDVKMTFRVREENRRDWVKMSTEFLVITLLSKMIFEAGTVIIGTFVGTTEAGYFFIATRTASLLTFVLHASNGVLGPMISQKFEKHDAAGMEHLYRLSLRFSIVASLLLAIGLVLGGEWVLGLFGEGFIVAYPLLLVLTIGQLGNAFVGSTGLILNMTGNQRLSVKILLSVGPLNLLALSAGVYFFGTMGAAVANSVSIIAANLVTAYFVWKRVGIAPIPFKIRSD